jgi:hypothetical protein
MDDATILQGRLAAVTHGANKARAIMASMVSSDQGKQIVEAAITQVEAAAKREVYFEFQQTLVIREAIRTAVSKIK